MKYVIHQEHERKHSESYSFSWSRLEIIWLAVDEVGDKPKKEQYRDDQLLEEESLSVLLPLELNDMLYRFQIQDTQIAITSELD